ncbi:MAG: 30S ribosomal protein S16 [Rickettsiella sp.]|nr:30S ribosomal protein S16 [Rickettsiella sp.]
MVTIRLARGGSKKRPFYHIVVTDSRQPRDGRYIDRLGYYNPMPAGNDVPLEIAEERIDHWISQGAQTSQRVKNLLKNFKKAGKITKRSDQGSTAT